jgi:hypothetical protein
LLAQALTKGNRSDLIDFRFHQRTEHPMNFSRIFFCAVFAFTFATLTFTVLFGTPPASQVPMAEGFQTPILALEFANSLEDVAFLQGLGVGQSNLRTALVNIQALDRYFPIAYAGMASVMFCGLALRGRKLAWAAAAIALLTIPADWMENHYVDSILKYSGGFTCIAISDRPAGTDLCLFMTEPDPTIAWHGVGEPQLLGDPEVRDYKLRSNLPFLQLTTWIKWGLIGLYAAFMSILMFRDKRRLLAVPGAVAAVAVAATWLSGSSGVFAELMGLAMIPFMLSFPVAAAMYLFRPSPT